MCLEFAIAYMLSGTSSVGRAFAHIAKDLRRECELSRTSRLKFPCRGSRRHYGSRRMSMSFL